MRYIEFRLIIIISFLWSLTSCNDCNNSVDCPENAIFEYSLVDSEGNNLFLTDSYDFNDVKITAFIDGVEMTNGGTYGDSIIYLEVIEDIDSILVDYGNDRVDVFKFSQFSKKDVACCNTYIDNFGITINNEVLCDECSSTFWEIER